MEGEFHLPEHIIQRVQSFLTAKEATQTTAVSKSWHSAWLARPNLDLDEIDFRRYYGSDPETDGFWEFWVFAKKIIQRYEELKLKIESLRLCVESIKYEPTEYEPRVCVNSYELIVKSLNMGATHLHFQRNCYSYEDFVIAHEVFGAENLVGLSLSGCKIDLGMDPKIRCSSLESLSLSKVLIIDCDMISNILSNCPLIKKLSLSSIWDFQLTSLEFDPMFFVDLSSRFPSIEDLTLQSCNNVREVSSRTLRRLKFSQDKFSQYERVKFDVPNMRKFMCESSVIPSVSFKSTYMEWESHVFIKRRRRLSMSWFRRLNKLLTKLRRSKIHLSLNVYSTKSFDYEADDIQGLPKPEVENLTMDVKRLPSLSCYALFDGLFLVCRPKFITQYLHPGRKLSNDFLWKTLAREMNGQFWNPSRSMYGLRDLMEVNVQLFDAEGFVWKHLPWESFLYATTGSKVKQKVRFQLKWKQ